MTYEYSERYPVASSNSQVVMLVLSITRSVSLLRSALHPVLFIVVINNDGRVMSNGDINEVFLMWVFNVE